MICSTLFAGAPDPFTVRLKKSHWFVLRMFPGSEGRAIQVGVFTPAPIRPVRLVTCWERLGTKNGPSVNVTFGLAAESVPAPTLVPYGGDPKVCATTSTGRERTTSKSPKRTLRFEIRTRYLAPKRAGDRLWWDRFAVLRERTISDGSRR